MKKLLLLIVIVSLSGCAHYTCGDKTRGLQEGTINLLNPAEYAFIAVENLTCLKE